MQKIVLALLFVFAALYCADTAHAAHSLDSGSTSGWGDNTVNQALAEEFAKCSAFSSTAAVCAKNGAREHHAEIAARYEDLAKRFYKGSYMLAGQDFTQKRVHYHDTSMRRSAGNACGDFPKLEQQYRKRCEDTFKRLPHKLQ